MELKATRLEKAAGVGLSLACFFTTDEAHGKGIVNEPVTALLGCAVLAFASNA